MTTEVYRDAWGIPHLRAADGLGLAYAQGREHRHRPGLADRGRTAPRRRAPPPPSWARTPSVWDRFARQSRLDDTARRCFEALDAATRAAWVRAYVDGVNAGPRRRSATVRRSSRRPGSPPGHWEPWVPLAHLDSHPHPVRRLPHQAVARAGRPTRSATRRSRCSPPTAPAPRAATAGWSPGDRTATGAPLIAGDPHRFIEDPGVYQQIHLACPDVRRRRPRRPRRPRHSPTSATPAPWPGRSPTRWPTTRTCTASGSAAPATGVEASARTAGARPRATARRSRWRAASRSRSR